MHQITFWKIYTCMGRERERELKVKFGILHEQSVARIKPKQETHHPVQFVESANYF